MTESTNPRPDIDLSRHSRAARPRAKNPAASAKILATGLSATAMLGMTAGYALAAREAAPSPTTAPTVDPSQGTSTTAAESPPKSGNSTAIAPLAPLAPGPSATSPQAAPRSTAGTQIQAPVTVQPQVVDIPVDTIAPATPGNGGDGWNTQPSSGSN